jgi:hypothetical protein
VIGVESGQLLRVVLADVTVITAVSVGIGASAPRWPRSWLVRDTGPLRLTRWDTVANYRRAKIGRLARTLPECGRAFGGVSKRTHPRGTRAEIRDYLVEVRRGEWVHWLSTAVVLPLLAFSPWWLWLSFLLVVALVNGVFIMILRGSRVRSYDRLCGLPPEPERTDA